MSDTFRAAHTRALGLGAPALRLAVTGCSGPDDSDDAEPIEGHFGFFVNVAGAPTPDDVNVAVGGGNDGFYGFASTS